MNELLEEALKLVRKYNENQFDKGGHPYIEHPLRVMEGVESIDDKVWAVLHDVVENCDVSRNQLINRLELYALAYFVNGRIIVII